MGARGIKFFGIIIIGFSFGLFFLQSCKKEKEPKEEQFNTTLIQASDIFPMTLGIPLLPTDNPLTEEGVYLGRMLFYDPVLSIDSSISCASCHRQEFAFGDPGRVSTGVFGLKTNRNAQSLFNLAYSRKFFWDGRQSKLRNLVFEPIQNHQEMANNLPNLRSKLQQIPKYKEWFRKAFNSEPDVYNMSLALEQFLLTLVSKDSKFDQFFPNKFSILTTEEQRGAILFNTLIDLDLPTTPGADCFHCHGGALVQQQNPSGGGITSNGLDANPQDPGLGAITGRTSDFGTFKTPSLRNIALSAPYMHDGRFSTLEEVVNFYSDSIHFNAPNISPQLAGHGGKQMKLTTEQKAQLVAFLKTMTDTVFINNPKYSNPFN